MFEQRGPRGGAWSQETCAVLERIRQGCLATEEFTGEPTEQVRLLSAFLGQSIRGARIGLLCVL